MNKIELANTLINLADNYFATSYEFGKSPDSESYGNRLLNKNIFLKELNGFADDDLIVLLADVENAANAAMLSGQSRTIQTDRIELACRNEVYFDIRTLVDCCKRQTGEC